MVEIVFVLVEPAVPANIGAAARAIKTMGFSKLRLVNPADHLAEEALWLAHGSNEILRSAQVYSSLADAIEDVDFAIGTTSKNRSSKQDYYIPEEAFKLIAAKSNALKVAGIVFGREESGLTNEELRLCDVASTVPLQNPYPSINLAQSVMIYAYVFSMMELNVPKEQSNAMAAQPEVYAQLKTITSELLHELEIDRNPNLYHRMLERIAAVGEDDAHLFLSLAKKFRQKFD
jgi:tRNA/rRNA methyltransferase